MSKAENTKTPSFFPRVRWDRKWGAGVHQDQNKRRQANRCRGRYRPEDS